MKSFLDQDLYTFTVGQAIATEFPDAVVSYKFCDRKQSFYNDAFLSHLVQRIREMAKLSLSIEEAKFLKAQKFLSDTYVDSLLSYRFDPSEVSLYLDGDRRLSMDIHGPWKRTVYWEVPLLAAISELYFLHCDTNWDSDVKVQRSQIQSKAALLSQSKFVDFGTRRRRNYYTQDLIVSELVGKEGFLGTSNVHLAMKHGVNPIGTMSHQWIMGVSALCGLRHANRYALEKWSNIFHGKLGIALADTFGTDAFLHDFDEYLARIFDGVRQDSGDPKEFGEKVIAHYQKMNIDPSTKSLVFSDGLTATVAAQLSRYFGNRIRVSHGIGTHFTNDFAGSQPLNIVIKLSTCNGIPVVKLSDVPTKAIGDRDALRVARWTFLNQPLDQGI